jgi:predicted CoA-binding protein
MPTYPDEIIKNVLRSTKTIAMVGASGNDMRPSYFAMMYLLAKGYAVHPINPGMAGKKILGQLVYGSLVMSQHRSTWSTSFARRTPHPVS